MEDNYFEVTDDFYGNDLQKAGLPDWFVNWKPTEEDLKELEDMPF